jgi:hypothetical protein
MSHASSQRRTRNLKAFALHLALYSALLFVYFLLVLRYWTSWLQNLFYHHRHAYAIVAILLMIVQAVGLEAISFAILKRVHGKNQGDSPMSS